MPPPAFFVSLLTVTGSCTRLITDVAMAGWLAEALVEALKMNGLAFENVNYGEIQLRGMEESTVE